MEAIKFEFGKVRRVEGDLEADRSMKVIAVYLVNRAEWRARQSWRATQSLNSTIEKK